MTDKEKLLSALKLIMEGACLLRSMPVEVCSISVNVARQALDTIPGLLAHENVSPERYATFQLTVAHQLIMAGNMLIKNRWDNNCEDMRAFGCYKALNSVCNVLGEKPGEEKDEDYVMSRLIEAIECLSKHYDITFREAMIIGGVKL